MLDKLELKGFVNKLRLMPDHEKEALNRIQYEEMVRDYNDFKEKIAEGTCSICGKSLKTFSSNSPCLHWLLRPKGFKKKHIHLLYENFSYRRISGYVRWLASLDGIVKNINDLSDEHPGGKVIDFTARYKNCMWSFSCGENDFEGHKSTAYGREPHYHMQIKYDGRLFLKYSDMHFSFHDEDLLLISLMVDYSNDFEPFYGPGIGMESVLSNQEGLKYIVDYSEPVGDLSESTFHMGSLIMARDGEKISSELIQEVLREAGERKKTMASIFKDKLKDKNIAITTIISPSGSVPEAQQRKGGRGK